jgi:hypothetical protein
MKRLFLISFFAVVSLNWAFAQLTATQQLNKAEDDYEAGILIGIPEQITGRMAEFSNAERVRAKKLLTLVYIFSDEEEKAEKALVDLLKEEPEYRLDPKVDPAELYFLYSQFRTEPIFKLSFRLGANNSYPTILGEYGTYDINEGALFINGKTKSGAVEKDYANVFDTASLTPDNGSLAVSMWAELMAEKHVGKGIELGGGLQFRTSKYVAEQFNNSSQSIEWTNTRAMLRTPFQIKYTYNYSNRDKKILPYAIAGLSYDYILSANVDVTSTIGIGASDNIDIKNGKEPRQINVHNMSYYFGLGAKYRVNTHFLSVELRYELSPFNYIDGDYRLSNQTSSFEMGYNEPDLKINMLSLSFAYTISVHNPVKKK